MKRSIQYIVYIQLFLLSIPIGAQVFEIETDSIHPYQNLILEIENNGLTLEELLKDNSFVNRLELEGYNKDSLSYYYERHKAAQVDDQDIAKPLEYLSMLAKSYQDSIVLRWAPSSEILWKKLNHVGYSLIRYELNSNEDERKLLILVDTINTLKPWPIEKIESNVSITDTASMIAAQALYGETMETDASSENLDFVSRKNVNEMQFGFALMMGDRSSQAAEVMGLRFVDKNVIPGKTYLYTLIANVEGHPIITSTGIKNDPNENAKVSGLSIKEEDSKINLIWPKNENNFSAYWIEKSSDNGASWQKTTDDVLVFIDNDEERIPNKIGDILINSAPEPTDVMADFFVYEDSTVNDINYQYRISGQTPFGDFSDYSYIDARSSDLTAPPIPLVISHTVDENNIARLEWTMDYDEDLLSDLVGFSVWESETSEGTYVQVSSVLSKDTRTYTSEDTLSKNQTHYYVLRAIDESGNESATFPLYMHVIDDVPPAAPREAVAVIDSNGVVTINWSQNTESDLLGYRIYFANDRSYELTQLTPEPIRINQFIDSIEIQSLSEEIYYRVQAVDKSHNRSDYSDWIIVKRPDIIPPVAPILLPPTMNDSIIVLEWKPSSSIDVVHLYVYRRPYQQGLDWEMIEELNATDTIYTDVSANTDILYEYTMQAEDDANLLSEFAFPVKARRWFNNEDLLISNANGVYDPEQNEIILSWEYLPPNKTKDSDEYFFYIYRSIGESSLMRYKIVNGNERVFNDQSVKINSTYNYALKVVYANGKAGKITTTISIKTPE